MMSIRCSAELECALNSITQATLLFLRTRRRDELIEDTDLDLSELAHIVVVEPGDTTADIEAVGFPTDDPPAFEYVEREGEWFEAVLIVSDDGFGFVLLMPDSPDIDTDLLHMMRERA